MFWYKNITNEGVREVADTLTEKPNETMTINAPADAEIVYLKGIENKKNKINELTSYIVERYKERLSIGEVEFQYPLSSRGIGGCGGYVSIPYSIADDVVDSISKILGDRFTVKLEDGVGAYGSYEKIMIDRKEEFKWSN